MGIDDDVARCLLGETVTTNRVAVKSVLRVNAGLLLSSTELGNRLGHGSNVNVSDLNTLVVVNFERFINNAGRSLNRDGLMRALAATELGLLVLSVLK